jgi:diguanylate cyclase (GGDEF)-like protein
VVVLVLTALGITVAVSQLSAGISLESFLFALAVVPYVIVTRELPFVRAGLSAFVLAAYIVCEFAFPEGSGDAELPADLAHQVTQFDRAGAGILLFLVVAVLETSRLRTQRVLEGAARYGELRATTDELTGVFNRRPVIAQLSEWAQRGRGNYAIALIDLDHFKTINDEFGHDCGDTILQAVASTLRSHFRDSDMVSRWGGDEFLVLIPGVRHADLVPILERLRRSITLIQKHCDEHVHTVTVSIGAAMGAMGQTPDECIAAADHALYRAKEEGRNKVVAVGVTEPTKALGRPSPDDLGQWTGATTPAP